MPGRPAAGRPARPARPGPGAQGRLPAGRGRRLGERRLPELRRPGQAGHRHDGHLRRLLLVLLPLLLARLHRRRRSTRPRCAAGCRSTSTSAASSTPSCTCCTAGSSPRCCYDMGMVDFAEPFTRLLNQGQVINQGKAMSKSLGNGVDLGEQIDAFGVDAVRLTMVFAGPPEDDIDWADMSPGRDRSSSWPGPGGSPPTWPKRTGHGRPAAATGDTRAAQGHPPDHRRGHPAGGGVPLQRRRGPADGAGQRHPQGDRLRARARPTRRSARRPRCWPCMLSLFAPYTAEEMLGAAGARAVGGAGPAGRRPIRRCWSRRRSPASSRSTARSATGWRSRRRSGRSELRELALAAPGVVRALGGQQVSRGHRAGAEAGQHRRGVTLAPAGASGDAGDPPGAAS